MFPTSVEARAKIKVIFLQPPLMRSFAVVWRFSMSVGGRMAMVEPINAARHSERSPIFI
jgi:hypothetical protein